MLGSGLEDEHQSKHACWVSFLDASTVLLKGRSGLGQHCCGLKAFPTLQSLNVWSQKQQGSQGRLSSDACILMLFRTLKCKEPPGHPQKVQQQSRGCIGADAFVTAFTGKAFGTGL